jgi:hypothetical protein
LPRNNFCTVQYRSECIYILQINFIKKKDVHYIFYFFLDNVSSTCFGVLFAPIIRSTTAAYSHRFGVFIPLEQVLVLGHFNTLARSVTDS